MDYQIVEAEIYDAEEILKIQKSAFSIETKRYNNYDVPPLKETKEELKGQFNDHILLKAVSSGTIIGSVRGHEKNGTCYIVKLSVHPDMQNQGVGTALMKEIEQRFNPKRYELFFGVKSENNIHLYQKLGYVIYQKAPYGFGDIEMFHMEKINR